MVTTTATQPKGLVLPPVSDVLVEPDGYGEEKVTGKLTNPYRTPIPSQGTIYAVLFNAKGGIVGGSLEPAGAAVEPVSGRQNPPGCSPKAERLFR